MAPSRINGGILVNFESRLVRHLTSDLASCSLRPPKTLSLSPESVRAQGDAQWNIAEAACFDAPV